MLSCQKTNFKFEKVEKKSIFQNRFPGNDLLKKRFKFIFINFNDKRITWNHLQGNVLDLHPSKWYIKAWKIHKNWHLLFDVRNVIGAKFPWCRKQFFWCLREKQSFVDERLQNDTYHFSQVLSAYVFFKSAEWKKMCFYYRIYEESVSPFCFTMVISAFKFHFFYAFFLPFIRFPELLKESKDNVKRKIEHSNAW